MGARLRRLLIGLLCAAAVAIGAYAFSPGFRTAADGALPGAVKKSLVAALSATHLLSAAEDTSGSAHPASAVGPAKGGGSIAVLAATAGKRDMPILRYAIGYIESPAVVSVNSRITSQVIDQHITDGQMVNAGDLLFTLDDRALKAQLAKDQATLAKDQALQASAEADLDRARSLFAQQTSSKQALDQAIANSKTSAANVAADNATIEADQLQLSYTKITAPIGGRLGAIQVHPGNLVNSGVGNGATPLVTITQVKPIRVSFALPASELPLLRKAIEEGTPPVVSVYAPGDYGLNGSKPMATGKLDFTNSSVDTASSSVVVKATFPNDDLTLWPGQYVNVVVETGVMHDLTVVPTVAVQQGQDGPFVFVVGSDGTVKIRNVAIALSEGETTGIGSGLEPGERVVTEGQLRLKNGTRVSVKEASATSGSAAPGPDAAAEAPEGTPRRS